MGFCWQEIHNQFESVDESLLATAGAWMRKAANDKMDGMVLISLLASRSWQLPLVGHLSICGFSLVGSRTEMPET